MNEWNLMMQKMNQLNRFNKKNNNFIRRFSAGVRMIEIDAADRILIPKDLALIGQITKDVVVSSAINIIEIWDKNLYENELANSVDDFANLAEEVMGNFDNNSHGIS